MTTATLNENIASHSTHTAVEIYLPCDCDPTEADHLATHFAVDGVGLTCARGLLYAVCARCCCGDNHAHCENTHVHGTGRPWCPTPH
ncbi:hypothetical protein [Mycobacterium hubeiense]|uniref:hypothetical protein n=1 Tax=Mycobacterium hubeiense TaxID=1867256 RepID=UPI000C7F4AC1|nr:hypothetical protein [Mycobacterium sp. QGD 101]